MLYADFIATPNPASYDGCLLCFFAAAVYGQRLRHSRNPSPRRCDLVWGLHASVLAEETTEETTEETDDPSS